MSQLKSFVVAAYDEKFIETAIHSIKVPLGSKFKKLVSTNNDLIAFYEVPTIMTGEEIQQDFHKMKTELDIPAGMEYCEIIVVETAVPDEENPEEMRGCIVLFPIYRSVN